MCGHVSPTSVLRLTSLKALESGGELVLSDVKYLSDSLHLSLFKTPPEFIHHIITFYIASAPTLTRE